MLNIDYPYMPPGHHLKYVFADHPFMIEAARARQECAGDSLYPVGSVLVKEGKVIARAGNGFNKGPGQIHVCPRVVLDVPSGTGYDLCHLHDAPGHAERMVLSEASRLGLDPTGSDAYLYGHWWACEPCWTALLEAGIRDLYVTDDAHERFARDKVYQETLSPSIKTVSLEGFDSELLNQVRVMLSELQLEIKQKGGDVLCVQTSDGVECFLKNNELIYTLSLTDQVVAQLRNVLRQL
ncbi:MAG: hypothetical protein UT30_C0006G0035 [Candidatus Uhrbacteria bacterium GW2011_GWF2_39_13]|uniref:CMP/dCMP-type deaminase domain-containing protein n=1 Tax=Candidatus Uhrbacteria bacterium GW2011_GWF2_39_13 TaxID=1618995 RepID=A0A0G0MVS2_9BACT|nr:MAG: hypothetical protein UT30_C0006G0035 [Candidatus Uhrbacteria bacterium GW2011_GWF2_39_13]